MSNDSGSDAREALKQAAMIKGINMLRKPPKVAKLSGKGYRLVKGRLVRT